MAIFLTSQETQRFPQTQILAIRFLPEAADSFLGALHLAFL